MAQAHWDKAFREGVVEGRRPARVVRVCGGEWMCGREWMCGQEVVPVGEGVRGQARFGILAWPGGGISGSESGA